MRAGRNGGVRRCTRSTAASTDGHGTKRAGRDAPHHLERPPRRPRRGQQRRRRQRPPVCGPLPTARRGPPATERPESGSSKRCRRIAVVAPKGSEPKTRKGRRRQRYIEALSRGRRLTTRRRESRRRRTSRRSTAAQRGSFSSATTWTPQRARANVQRARVRPRSRRRGRPGRRPRARRAVGEVRPKEVLAETASPLVPGRPLVRGHGPSP